jgi:hypothetical protein
MNDTNDVTAFGGASRCVQSGAAHSRTTEGWREAALFALLQSGV